MNGSAKPAANVNMTRSVSTTLASAQRRARSGSTRQIHVEPIRAERRQLRHGARARAGELSKLFLSHQRWQFTRVRLAKDF
jgi:hypothetical protein